MYLVSFMKKGWKIYFSVHKGGFLTMLNYICLLRYLAYKKYDRKYLQQGLKYGSQLASAYPDEQF